ncbi:MAG: transketolase C-terminal domain-containing protein [Desulfobacterales bacterium]
MRQVVEGSHAVSEAVRLAGVRVVSAYPITPQTHIVEALSEYCAAGKMDARFICVESEHSAMAAAIGAATGGVRTFTATSSQGLAYMHELLHWASAARLPIVMAEVNRALAPGWNIWTDQTDSLAQRDTGWIQLYCENGQEVLDTTLMAFRLAERVRLPVMVVLDAFFLSHTYEPVDIPDQDTVDRFLPALEPRGEMDVDYPANISQMSPPAVYMEMRHAIEKSMACVPAYFSKVEEEFQTLFGRRYGLLEPFFCEDADVILLATGTNAGNCRHAVGALRRNGEKAGLVKLKMFRPFPGDALRRALKHSRKIAVIDRNCSFGVGGIFAQELKAALYRPDHCPEIYSYIAGLGGRDITPETIESIYRMTKEGQGPFDQSVWIGSGLERMI